MTARAQAIRLCLCGAAILFWELLLIRWAGSCIRVVAYYTNFVLIGAFFGLGTGALLARYQFRSWRLLVPTLCLSILIPPLLGSVYQFNPTSAGEYIWVGAPVGVLPSLGSGANLGLPYWVILAIVYVINTGVFLMFGQWLGLLFKQFHPLRAYTIEIGGSIIGILLFAAVSYAHAPPPIWFLVGFGLVVSMLELDRRKLIIATALALFVTISITPFTNQFLWSRYYKIHLSPLSEIVDRQHQRVIQFNRPIGVHLTVNNDYHQMILDLRPRSEEHPFLQSWRWIYDYPYQAGDATPAGPILIVGAGTGNDVSAALRRTTSAIDAVEIDPLIVATGRRYHPEQPYANPRVHVFVDDARSFFATTKQRYAAVVFGFLDSHTLMSSFSSLRLDNFVYTREAMERVKKLLLPGGKVFLTFASNTQWLDHRLAALLESVFDYPTQSIREPAYGYANGVVYLNGKAPEATAAERTEHDAQPSRIKIPTDDWPFLYMKDATMPSHYQLFIAMVVLMGVGSLFLLPRGQRQIKFPYFFMGAGFFLLETSNVVSLSLLYGSTWIVNVAVFTGILTLILCGNLTCMQMARPRYPLLFVLLFISVFIAYLTKPSALLGMQSKLFQGFIAVPIFLGPVYLASLIFGHLIKKEARLYQAYGSNLLGAVIGGSCEYFSIVTGLKFLLLLTLLFYFLACTSLAISQRKLATT